MQNSSKGSPKKLKALEYNPVGQIELDTGIISTTLVELLNYDPETVGKYGLILQDITSVKLSEHLGTKFKNANLVENPKSNLDFIELETGIHEELHGSGELEGESAYARLYNKVHHGNMEEGSWQHCLLKAHKTWELGFELALKEKWEEAIETLGEAILSKEMPQACAFDNSRFVLYFHFIYLHALKAISEYRRGISNEEISLANYLIIMMGHLAAGVKSRAVSIADEIIEMYPDVGALYRLRARCKEAHRLMQNPHTKEYDVTILADYSKAIEIDPKDYLAYFERGCCIIVEEQYLRDSISDLKRYLELAPQLHVERCAAYYLIGCNLALLPGGCKVHLLRKYLHKATMEEIDRESLWRGYHQLPKEFLTNMIRKTSHIPFYMKYATGPLQEGIEINTFFNTKRWSPYQKYSDHL